MLEVRLLFFGRFRELFSALERDQSVDRQGLKRVDDALMIELKAPTTIQQIVAALQAQFPDVCFEELKKDNTLYSLNHKLCDIEAVVSEGDELAFMPPVTGG